MSDTPRSDFVWDHFQKCGGPYRLTNVSQQLERELTNIQRKLALAEARVKELEGLEVELTKHPTTGDYVLVTVRIKRDAHKPCKFNLGDAMPRKEGV